MATNGNTANTTTADFIFSTGKIGMAYREVQDTRNLNGLYSQKRMYYHHSKVYQVFRLQSTGPS